MRAQLTQDVEDDQAKLDELDASLPSKAEEMDLPTEEGLQICAEYGIQLPMQTSFIDWPQEPDSYLRSILGDKRAAWLNPLRAMWDKGIVMSAGSDAPCTDPDPILWIQRACNHDNPEQSLTIKEALRMCTYNGAWTTFDEDER